MGPQSSLLVTLLAVGLTVATNYEYIIKRQLVTASQLRDAYDFVIVGGGTSGLTLADRLSEAFPAKTVLVIEYGEIEAGRGTFDPPDLWETGGAGGAGAWDFFSQPNLVMNNKTAFIRVGKTVGGGSAVNGQFFDRGSRHDYDAWDKVYGNGGPNNIKWDWKGLIPYFKKSVTFTKPSSADAEKYGYTWDIDSAYGGTTPIYSSFPPFQWADQKIFSQAYQDLGLKVSKECAGGDKQGVCWVPTSEHPLTMRRSHSGLGHYALVQGSRSNYDLLVKHQVVRVVYPTTSSPPAGKATKPTKKKHQPPLVEVKAISSPAVFNITVKAEVIISAGAFNTPAVLQRSGIGPPAFLQSAGIPLVIDSPGVGANLQDHGGASINWNLTLPLDASISPIPNDLLANSSYYSLSSSQFDQTPAQGPYTLALGNSAIYVSLPKIAPDSYQSIISQIRSLASPSSSSLLASYLPPGSDYASNPAMVAGYKSQLLTLADLLSNPAAPSNESPFASTRTPGAGPNAWAFLLHPLSRGTVHINTADPLGQPILDYRAGTNPLDFDLHLSHLKFLRKLGKTYTFAKYGAVETSPGEAAVQTDEQWREYVKRGITLSFQHPCCTAAMISRERGGVVGRDLRVHGAEELGGGLRVVDMSIAPLLVGSHTSATAYAVGEKAADIIIKEWSTGPGH